MNPDQEIAHFNLGWLLLQSDPVGSTHHFREAARLVPDKGGVYLGLSSALLAQGEARPALVALAAELANDPAFCASPIWSMPQFASVRAAALSTAADKLDSIAPGDARADRVASLFRWLADDSGNAGLRAPAEGLTRDAFSPAIATAKATRRQRTAYPLMMRNADMPAPVDLQFVIQDPATMQRLASLFPAKGWLSGPQLRRLLDESGDSSRETVDTH
jgi:hypothetical protein